MDINAKRIPSLELRKVMKLLQFYNNPIEVLGSAGLASQMYHGDYDLFSSIEEQLTPTEIYKEYIQILDRIEKDPNIYFIETKVHRKNNTQTKFYPPSPTLHGSGLFSAIKSGFNTVKNTVSNIITPQHNFTLNANFPPSSMMYHIIDNAYKEEKDRDQTIRGYAYVYGTPTLVFYFQNNIMLVGVRGTADARDLKADGLIPFGQLNKSARYLEDVAVLRQVKQQYPQATFYGAAHSLGGALCDLFLQEGLLSQAISYNPAVERAYMTNTNNKRLYISSDALYNTMGRFASNTEVRSQPNQSLLKKVLTNTSGLGLLYKSGTSHLLTNFEGGGRKAHPRSYRDKKAFLLALKKVDYIKIDVVVRIHNIFTELSILYSFTDTPPPSLLIKNFETEIKTFLKDKNYYKALKRLFSLYKAQGNYKGQLPLSRFFNSKVGEAYQKMCNLLALRLLLHHNPTKAVQKKIIINLKDLHLPPHASIDRIDMYIDLYEKEIQKEAKKLWNKLK